MRASFADDIVSVTNLRKDLPAMLDRVRSGVPITIMQGDRADLAIVRRADLAARDAETEALRDQLVTLPASSKRWRFWPTRACSTRSKPDSTTCARAAWSRSRTSANPNELAGGV